MSKFLSARAQVFCSAGCPSASFAERSKIEFCIPAGAIEFRQIGGSYFLSVEQRGYDDYVSTAKSRLLNWNARLAIYFTAIHLRSSVAPVL